MYKYGEVKYKSKKKYYIDKRNHYFYLITKGYNSSQACRIVGVDKRQGKVWRNGRSWSNPKKSNQQYI